MSATEQETRSESLSSVKLTTNAKGEVQPEIKVYATSNAPFDVENARDRAVNLLTSTLAQLKAHGLRP